MKKIIQTFLLMCVFLFEGHAQLGFCSGNSGDPIFTETFGTGTTNTSLPAGTTTYTFASNDPHDGFYTVSSNTGFFDWHNTTDHTAGDTNGKCLIVNADFTTGEFYRTTINGLCENTSYEFSSWLMNLLPPSGCGGNGIPINVKFQIWDVTDTNLLASGDTGNISGTITPNWEQYGLVFQTLPSQTSVILKMLNNSVGGCGNDLAIDDIVFKTCGDFISVSDITSSNNSVICSSQTPYALDLIATPDNTVFSSHFYQWQESTDASIWIDIVGATNQNISIAGITTTTYYRAKIAEYASNLTDSDCITFSDIYQITVNQASPPPTLDCWETATFNDITCSWTVIGTQPSAPTGLACWEAATFNSTTCTWVVFGSQPSAPTGLACWETANFNNATCVWDVTGTQPVQPFTECWETATFNNATCLWELTGTQPLAPTGLACWETSIFNNTTCVWEVSGVQPPEPTDLECWQTTIFNNLTCIWDIIGEEPTDTIEESVVLCEDSSIILQANSSIVNPSFLWNTGAITEEITVNLPGTYTVEITDETCFTIVKTIYVSLIESPQISNVVSDGNDIVVEMENTGNFEYSLDDVQYQTSNIFISVEGGLYTVYVKERNGCGITSTNHLHFAIPKFFTPNNDGIHDTFNLKGIENYTISEVYIFDRYGKLLKSSKNQPFIWDGTFNNLPLPNADYWYFIKIDNQEFRGHFTLKR